MAGFWKHFHTNWIGDLAELLYIQAHPYLPICRLSTLQSKSAPISHIYDVQSICARPPHCSDLGMWEPAISKQPIETVDVDILILFSMLFERNNMLFHIRSQCALFRFRLFCCLYRKSIELLNKLSLLMIF